MKELGLEILNKIHDYGYDAYVVGGYVRDSLLGIESGDIDITTNATPMELKNIFLDEKMEISNYGSVILYYKKNHFDITTFRKEEKYLDNRHPSAIVYINDLKTDLLRRDFTINALCIDKDGNLIDLIDGVKDLNNRVLKTIIDSDESFKTDALRILRAIRFASSLDFTMSDDIEKAIIKNKDLLKNISHHQKKKELDKMFASSHAKEAIELIKKFDLQDSLDLPSLDRIKDYSDIVGIWAMIDSQAYNFTSNEKELIKDVNIVYDMDNLSSEVLYKYGMYVNVLAGINKGIKKKDIIKAYENLPIKNKEEIDISADEICEIYQREAGPFIGDVYKDLENKILSGNLNNNNILIKEYLMEEVNE